MLDELRDQYPQPFEARIYADTGPINERVLAKHAGLGWLGKNTLLLNERIGSFFFLGVILTTLDLQPTLGIGGGSARGPLRHLPQMHRCLPNRRAGRTLRDGCAKMHFVPDHRAARINSRTAS